VRVDMQTVVGEVGLCAVEDESEFTGGVERSNRR